MKPTTLYASLATVATYASLANAGPAAYGICQAGWAAVAVACYGAAGFTMGVALPAAPPAIVACNSVYGTCQAACAAVLLMPTP